MYPCFFFGWSGGSALNAYRAWWWRYLLKDKSGTAA